MEFNKIFTLDNYEEGYIFAMKNNYLIEEIDGEQGKRKFKFVEKRKISEEDKISQLRSLREMECFSVVNRGNLWYEKLTIEEYLQLKKWYQEWLDVTATKVIPIKPTWIN